MKEGRDLEFSNWDEEKKEERKRCQIYEFERKKEERKRSNLQIWNQERKRSRVYNDLK